MSYSPTTCVCARRVSARVVSFSTHGMYVVDYQIIYSIPIKCHVSEYV